MLAKLQLIARHKLQPVAKSKLQLVAKSGSALPFPRLGLGEHFRFAEHPFQAIFFRSLFAMTINLCFMFRENKEAYIRCPNSKIFYR